MSLSQSSHRHTTVFIVFQECLFFYILLQQEVPGTCQPRNLPCLVFESSNTFLTYTLLALSPMTGHHCTRVGGSHSDKSRSTRYEFQSTDICYIPSQFTVICFIPLSENKEHFPLLSCQIYRRTFNGRRLWPIEEQSVLIRRPRGIDST